MQINIMKNVFEHKVDKEFTKETTLIDYLQIKYPNGFDSPTKIYDGFTLLSVEEYDKPFSEFQSECNIVHFPGVAITATAFGAAWFGQVALALAISVATAYIVGQLFAPDIPDGITSSERSDNKASSVYNLNSQQNEAKLGQTIPLLFGRSKVVPALVERPYAVYENNEQYMYQLMCIGADDVVVREILLEDTPLRWLSGDLISYKVFNCNGVKDIQDYIRTTIDPQYIMRSRRSREVENLEIKNSDFARRESLHFAGNQVYFKMDAHGNIPDISSVQVGDTVNILNSLWGKNAYKTFTVNAVGTDYLEADITFDTEDRTVIPLGPLPPYYIKTIINENGEFYNLGIDPDGREYRTAVTVDFTGVFTINDGGPNDGVEIKLSSDVGAYNEVRVSTSDILHYQEWTIPQAFNIVALDYNIDYTSWLGPFVLNGPNYGIADVNRGVELDITFPSGLYEMNTTDGSLIEHTVSIDVKIDVVNPKGQVVDTFNDTYTKTAATVDPIRETWSPSIRVYGEDYIYTLNIRRSASTPVSEDSNISDKVYLESVKYNESNPDTSKFGNLTLLWLKAKASNGLSSYSTFKFSCIVDGISKLSRTDEVIHYLYTNTEFGAGLNVEDLRIMQPSTFGFNGSIDTKMTVMDALKLVAAAGRYQVVLKGRYIDLIRDEVQPIRKALFNETNILKDTFNLTYVFGKDDYDYDGVQIAYRDPITFDMDYVVYPDENVAQPYEIELIGCTSRVIAYDEARYQYKQKLSRRKTVTFETDQQGLIPEFLDRIGVTHSTMLWAEPGQISKVEGRVITLDRSYKYYYESVEPINCEDPIDCPTEFCERIEMRHIMFRDPQGQPSDVYEFAIIDERNIELLTDPPEWLYDGIEYDKTFFSMGAGVDFVRDYLVMKVDVSDTTIKIEGINYDESIYI